MKVRKDHHMDMVQHGLAQHCGFRRLVLLWSSADSKGAGVDSLSWRLLSPFSKMERKSSRLHGPFLFFKISPNLQHIVILLWAALTQSLSLARKNS
jgi:hypothetical protein